MNESPAPSEDKSSDEEQARHNAESGFRIGISRCVVSLLAAFGAGMLLHSCTASHLALEYDLVLSEPFEGKSRRVAIAVVKVYNAGNKEVEDLTCRLEVHEAAISDHKISGLPPSDCSVEAAGAEIVVETPFLNTADSLVIQVLVESLGGELSAPSVDIRGKGATATQREAPVVFTARQLLVQSLVGGFISFIVLLFLIRSRLSPLARSLKSAEAKLGQLGRR
jgi:hypothetical protein